MKTQLLVCAYPTMTLEFSRPKTGKKLMISMKKAQVEDEI